MAGVVDSCISVCAVGTDDIKKEVPGNDAGEDCQKAVKKNAVFGRGRKGSDGFTWA